MMLQFAASNGDHATGQMQALQAQNQHLTAIGSMVQQVNDQLQHQFVYQVDKDRMEELKQAELRRFMEPVTKVQRQPWVTP